MQPLPAAGSPPCSSVSRAFETSRRREALSFKHHAEVAGMPPAVADELLDEAEGKGPCGYAGLCAVKASGQATSSTIFSAGAGAGSSGAA